MRERVTMDGQSKVRIALIPDVFGVIGDPVRRHILVLIRDEELCVNELTQVLGITQPSVSKHLRILREAGLVSVRVEGQRRWYRLVPNGLAPLSSWLGEITNEPGNAVTVSAEAQS